MVALDTLFVGVNSPPFNFYGIICDAQIVTIVYI